MICARICLALALGAASAALAIPAAAEPTLPLGLTAEVNQAGDLLIAGTVMDDVIVVEPLTVPGDPMQAVPGSYVVGSESSPGPDPIDGFVVHGVTRNIRIDGRGGEDWINVHGVGARGRSVAETGVYAGAALHVAGDLTIIGRGGEDVFSVVNATVADDVVMLGGASNDELYLLDVLADDLRLLGQRDGGNIILWRVEADRANLNTGGDSSVQLGNSEVNRLTVRGSSGIEDLYFYSADLGLNPTVYTAGAGDFVELDDNGVRPLVWAGTLRINTGPGPDSTVLFRSDPVWDESTVLRFDLLTGAGDDEVYVTTAASTQPVHRGRIDGGSGTNSIFDPAGVFPTVRRFERP